MTTSLYGADVAELRQLAQKFDRAADQLESATNQLTGTVGRAPAWTGPDATRFRSEWTGTSAPKLRAVASELRSAAGSLTRNADDQERTSAADSGGSLASTPSSATPAPSARTLDAASPASIAAVIDSIKNGGRLPSGVTPYDLVSALDKVKEIPGFGEASGDLDVVNWAARFQSGQFNGYDAVDMLSTILHEPEMPLPAQLVGTAAEAIANLVQVASQTDFSAATFATTWAYVQKQPQSVLEAFGQATVQEVTKAISWLPDLHG